jgi:neopullulanase
MKKLIILFLVSIKSFAQIEKVEPPFWYTDMNLSKIQIMFYGKNISENQVSVSNKIKIIDIKKTENPNYLFVTIDTKKVVPQDIIFSFAKNKKLQFTHNYSIKSRLKDSKNRKSFDSSDLIYLIMPDRFANGNPNNDSTINTTEKSDRANSGGRHGGDIAGIIKNLDYIDSLGATAIWSTPLCEDNDEKYSYHGYGQSDVYKIDPRYGSNDDYLKLSTELHNLGMKNIMDYVTNHWGWQHWMIKDLPTKTWINQWPEYTQSNFKMATQSDENASKIDFKKCVDGWFVNSMPDLNQSNPLVLNYLTQNAIWWIEFANLDGLRVDTYTFNDKKAMAIWAKSVTDEYPNLNVVGEVWLYTQAQNAYWQKDSKIGAIQNYNSNLPSIMDFGLHEILISIFNEDIQDRKNGIIKIYDHFSSDFLFPNINNLMVFAENHDTNRLNDNYKNDFKKYQMALTMIATIRGIPQIYYGSEVGLNGNREKNGDGDIRKDFPGGWQSDTNNAFTKLGRTEEQNKFHDFTSKLFNWRKSNEAIHFGKTKHYVPENNVYVYFRYNDKKTVMIVINNSLENQKIKTNRFQENILSFSSGKDVLSDKNINLKNDIEIEGKSILILELK